MNTASRPPIHAAAAPSDAGVPKSASARAALAVTVTGLIFANACSQCGKVETGTNTELAKTSGEDHDEPGRLRRLGAADGEGHEGEDPAEGEAEGGAASLPYAEGIAGWLPVGVRTTLCLHFLVARFQRWARRDGSN